MSDERRVSAHDGPRLRPTIGKVGRGEQTERCADPPPRALRQGIEEFNRGQFFEQHETLEAAWIAEADPVRYLYQGILQIGVGFYHLSRGNGYGARRLWTRGVALLESFRPACQGVDLTALIADTTLCIDEIERVGDGDIAEFNRGLIPRVRLTPDE